MRHWYPSSGGFEVIRSETLPLVWFLWSARSLAFGTTQDRDPPHKNDTNRKGPTSSGDPPSHPRSSDPRLGDGVTGRDRHSTSDVTHVPAKALLLTSTQTL